MAEWRARGYVQDSDEEEDSQSLTSISLTASGEAVDNNDTEAVKSSEPHDVKASDRQDESEILLVQGGIEEKLDTNAGEGNSSTATLLVQHEKEDALSPAVEHSGYNTQISMLDIYEDIDELQQDHYGATSVAQPDTEMHDLESKPCLSPVPPNEFSVSSSLSSVPPSEVSHTRHGTPSTPGTQSSTRREQRDDWGSSIDHGLEASGPNPRRSTTDEVEHPVVNQLQETQRGGRNLRHRNAIQRAPYTIEHEQYQKNLKARGVKPLRIAQMEAEAAKSREQDSQNNDFNGGQDQFMDSDAEEPAPYSSSPVNPQSSPIALSPPRGKGDIFVFDDDDLPDISTLLSHSKLKYVGNGHKRRKTAKATLTAFKTPQRLDLYQAKSLPGNEANSAFNDDDGLFDVPPSPPHSGSQTPKRNDRPAFRMPRRLSSAALPTPITSSEPRRMHQLEIPEDEQSDDQSLRIRPTADIDDSTDAELSPPEEETSHQFQRAQRKIRGVLPASYLKLDLKSQNKKPADTPKSLPSISPERITAQRGVARVVSAPDNKRSITPSLRHAFEVLPDDESPSPRKDEPPQQIGDYQRQRHEIEDESGEGLFLGRWGEAAEDDQIDAMLPAAKRAFHSRKSSKRQTKIGDFPSHSRMKAPGISKKASINGVLQRKITNQHKKGHQTKPKFRPPRLGILDTPLAVKTPQCSVPQFLKVASRTARSRHDKGRHSPSRKILRLATNDDSNDVNETLRDWREGTIVPVVDDQISEASTRQPLYPRSANNQIPSTSSKPEQGFKESKLPASRISLVKPHVRSTKSRKLQTSLNLLIERRSRDDRDPTQRKAPSWLHQAIEKQKKRGQIVSSLGTSIDSRPALLESAREDADRTHAQAVFHRDLARVNHFDDDSGLPGVVVRRFLGADGTRPMNFTSPQTDRVSVGQDAPEASKVTKKVHPNKQRKRQPRRMSISETWPREPSVPIILDDYPDEALKSYEVQRRDMLVGLGPFGTRYSNNFNVTPLPTGTCFSARTLLGSGACAKALQYAVTANLECLRGYNFFKLNGRNLRWGPWNDAVSSDLGELFEVISQLVQNIVCEDTEGLNIRTFEQVLLLLKSTLEYFSNYLSFLDPVDRVACVLRCKGLLSSFVIELINHNAISNKEDQQAANNIQSDIQINILALSLANQLLLISRHELIPSKLQDEVEFLVQKAAQHTLDLSLRNGIEPFETCLSKFRNQTTEHRIQEHVIEAFVVAQHVFKQDQDSKTNVWLTLQKAIPNKSSDGIFDISLAEQAWRQLFILLPFLEVDTQGVVETGRRFKVPLDNWTFIKRLINPVLEAFVNDPHGQPPSFNSYCRAVFGRCLHLINGWGWRRCESIIGIVFDYFARNGLAHLRLEESKGSPLFLERLDQKPVLVSEPEDRGFHILLKMIGSGLRHMRQSYPEKKIRDVVWRLMPNHGRSHPKEEAIRQEDLDALRNHHDLLCTLYWASPPSCRPRLTVIRNLVNVETSHREACHINIRAWFNLAKFQLSTDGPFSNLEPFAEWHNHILAQILRQHSLARTEAEDQVRLAQSVDGIIVSKELLETTIARNQRQAEAVLSDALVCLKLAIDNSQSPKAASTLLSTTLAKVFELFDASRNQANKPIMQALDVLSACASKCSGPREENEESQDYGDWSAFEDNDVAVPMQEDNTSLLDEFRDPLRHLLWNCFGADQVPDDALLLKVVEAWIIVAQLNVRNGLRSWADYLGHFGNDSWSSLRDTEQTRKFSVYYLATLIEKDSKIYYDHKALFLMSWVCSLVERESLLKFQHRLTSALLNVDSENPLLRNLPFWRDAVNGEFRLTGADFSGRRLSLISSVLSNMRTSLESAVFEPSVTGNELRQDFRDLLKHLMATMKRNYQELGHGSNVKGAYVDFVHRVIELLQQHTSTICPIDRFFTDNGAFPLPATDPTYVVGQLKNYALRLRDARTPKQLVVFLQSVSERAALDGQQPYLVGQLCTAMTNAFEDGVSLTPTLRSFLAENIVPAYVECAFSTECGWLLAVPYLQALQEVFEELLQDLDGANSGSVTAVANTVTAFLGSMRQSLEPLAEVPSDARFKDAATLKTISACYSAITALLPVLDYILRLEQRANRVLIDHADFCKSFAVYVSAVLRGDSLDDDALYPDHGMERLISDTCTFAMRELRDALSRTWIRNGERYFAIRGSTRREVLVDVGLVEEEKMGLLGMLGTFRGIWGIMPALRGEDDDGVMMGRGRRSFFDDELRWGM